MKPHLGLFLSRDIPLAAWHRSGILEREIALYRRLSDWFDVSIISSGGLDELAYQARLGSIQILPNRWRIPANAYSILAPILHQSRLKKMSIYKTNQFDGGWTAVLAGKLHRKPVIARAGYLWAESNRQAYGTGLKAAMIDKLQTFTVRQATHTMVTTSEMKAHLIKIYGIPSERLSVIPNYVDMDLFRPDPDVLVDQHRICYIGRLHPVKNLALLIEAVGGIPDCHVQLIGQGPQHDELVQLAQQNPIDVHFTGALPHAALPVQINRAALFVLPSQFEGHPKALIEAMACGTAVLGTDVPGIRELIQHGQTGWLCPPTAAGLRDAIRHLLADPALRRNMGRAAREYALQTFSLQKIAAQEAELLQQVQTFYGQK